MESALIVTITLLVLIGGGITLLSRQGVLPWSLPALRTFGGALGESERESDTTLSRTPGSEGIVEHLPENPTAVLWRPAAEGSQMTSLEELDQLPEPVRLDLVPSPAEALAARLDRFEERLDEIARWVERQSAEVGQELRRARAEFVQRAESDDARWDASLERLRMDVQTAVSRAATEGYSRIGTKRPEVTAELYARLARLEAALAAVTNPILLPGERYVPPEEFLPEALVWENWNEVGERAFSLADAYSAQRLHLSEETRREIDTFVTTLRTLLTRSVYPNLQPEPDANQQAALRIALEEIAAELPNVRRKLEWEYREGRSI